MRDSAAELREETGRDPAELIIEKLSQFGINPEALRTMPMFRGKTISQVVQKFLQKQEKE